MTPLALAPLLAALAAPPAPPRETPDATYGRIDGDVALVVGLGVTLAPRGPRAAAELRARYLDTVGVFAGYEDGALLGAATDPTRVLAFGVELRPLFLARWLKGRELGDARVDLAIDSLGLEIGPYFSQPDGGSFGERPGLELGAGLELPIFARASGPWLGVHGGVRWSDLALAGQSLRGPIDRAAYLALTLAWHQFVGAHVVDVGDSAR